MVEIDIEVQTIEEAFSRLKAQLASGLGIKEIIASLGEFAKEFGTSSDVVAEMTKELIAVSREMKRFASEIGNFGGEKFHKWIEASKEKLVELKAEFGDGDMHYKAFGAKLGAITIGMKITNAPDALKEFNKLSSDISNSQTQMLSLIPAKAPEELKTLAKYVDANRNLERGMVMTAGATGNMSDLFKKAGADLSGLDSATQNYGQTTREIGDIVGLTSSQTAGYLNQLMLIPGMADDINKNLPIAGQQMHLLTGVLQVAAGTGRSNEAVFTDLGDAVSKLGLSGTEAITFMSQMRSAAEVTGVPIEKMSDFAKKAAESFAMFGDNTTSVISMMKSLGPALRDGGASPEQIIKIMSEATDGIAKMSTAQRAFLSSQTGGPGGLQGAFQIEQMIADGKSAEVMAKVRENMMQKIGVSSIVTREQASQDSGAAAQYAKQRAFMMSPAMGGVAKDEQSAAKLFDAWAKGGSGSMPTLDDAKKQSDKELSTTMSQGNVILTRSNNELIAINNKLQQLAVGQASVFNTGQRKFLGSGSDSFNERLADRRTRAEGNSGANYMTGADGKRGKPMNEYWDDVYKSGENLVKAAELLTTGYINPSDLMGKLAAGGTSKKQGGAFSDLGSGDMFPAEAFADMGINKEFSSSSKPFNDLGAPRQFSSRDVVSQDLERVNKEKNIPAIKSSSAQHVNVNVTTVCNECTRKIATKQAQVGINNAMHEAHDHDAASPWHPPVSR